MFIKKQIIKITLLICLFIVMPLNVFAASENNIAMVKTEENKYIIYVENVKNTFRYAITADTQNTENLEFTVSSEDAKGNNVAILDLTKHSSDKDLSIVIKNGNKQIISKIDKNNYIDSVKLNYLNTTTKRIPVITNEVKVTKKDSLEKEEEVTVNKVVMEDKTKKYQYSLRKIEKNTDEEKVSYLVNKINKFDKKTDMYEIVKTYISLDNLYNNLMKNSKFNEVKNFEVLQPEEAVKDDKYLLLLKDSEKSDMQILTCERKVKEGVKEITENKVLKKAVKLPVAGDNVLLLIGFGLVVIVLVCLLVYKKKINSKK